MKSESRSMVALCVVSVVALMTFRTASACSDVSVDGCPTVIEVDDTDATFGGSWSKNDRRNGGRPYGTSFRATPGSGALDPTKTATFVAPLDAEVGGDYSVFARWNDGASRCATVRHMIYDGPADPANLVATVSVNEQVNGGEWRRLATVRLTPNRTPTVVIDNGNNCAAASVVVVDAIRFVREDTDHNGIVDEPGYEVSQRNSIASADLELCSVAGGSTNWTTLATIILTTPRDHGIVWVHVNGISRHFTDHYGRVCLATTGGCTSWAPFLDQSSTEVAEGSYERETRWTLSDTFSATGSSQTFRLKGCRQSATANVDLLWDDFVGIYLPTRY